MALHSFDWFIRGITWTWGKYCIIPLKLYNIQKILWGIVSIFLPPSSSFRVLLIPLISQEMMRINNWWNLAFCLRIRTNWPLHISVTPLILHHYFLWFEHFNHQNNNSGSFPWDLYNPIVICDEALRTDYHSAVFKIFISLFLLYIIYTICWFFNWNRVTLMTRLTFCAWPYFQFLQNIE